MHLPVAKPERAILASNQWPSPGADSTDHRACPARAATSVGLAPAWIVSLTPRAMSPAGVHPKVGQERLGHSTIGTTLGIYSHVTECMQEDATEAVAGLFL